MIGRMTAFATPSTAAPMMKAAAPSIVTPSQRRSATHSATAFSTNAIARRIRNDTGASLRNRMDVARQNLAGVQDPVGVEEVLQRAEVREQVAVLALEVADLAEADAVLAGAGPPARERPLDELVVQGLGVRDVLGVVWVEHQRDVKVAVADVPDDRAVAAARVQARACIRDGGGKLRERHGHVGRHRLLTGR